MANLSFSFHTVILPIFPSSHRFIPVIQKLSIISLPSKFFILIKGMLTTSLYHVHQSIYPSGAFAHWTIFAILFFRSSTCATYMFCHICLPPLLDTIVSLHFAFLLEIKAESFFRHTVSKLLYLSALSCGLYNHNSCI